MSFSFLSSFRSSFSARSRKDAGFESGKTRRRPARHRGRRVPLEQLEDRLLMTVSFTPAFGSEQVFWRSTDGGQKANTVITSPIPRGGNPDVLDSETVYLIFWGTGWNTTNVKPMDSAAVTICNSPFFSLLSDYGSDGKVSYTKGDYVIDSSSDPTSSSSITTEIQKELGNKAFALPGGGSVLNSPIYIVVESFGNKGFNDPNGSYQVSSFSPKLPFNEILIGNGGYNDVDGFSDLFSHEVAERMSDGTGNGIGVNVPQGVANNTFVPGPPQSGVLGFDGNNSQISDNEPDGSRYTTRLNGTVLVQAYWSISQRAFVIPDTTGAPTVEMDPIWNRVNTNSASFTNTFGMTVDGQNNETITIQTSPGNSGYVEVWQSSISTTEPVYTGNWSAFSGRNIVIDVGYNDSVNVRNLPANVTLEIESDYADTINVSPGTDQTTILGTIEVFNFGTTSATLSVNDSSDSAPLGRTVTFFAGPNGLDQIATSGLGTIYYDYSDAFRPSIEVTGSRFGNTYDVVRADVHSLTIHSNGSDSVTLGSSTDGVQAITGDVILTNRSASTNLILDDSANSATRYTVGLGWSPNHFGDNLSYGTVDGLLPKGSSVFYEDSSLSSLMVRTSHVKGNTVNIGATFAPTYVITGGNSALPVAFATVNVGSGGAVPLIYGDVYIESPNGANTVNVNDSHDSVIGRRVTLSDYTPPSPGPPRFDSTDTFGRISGLTRSGATINYEYNDTMSVIIQIGGGDTVNVLSTGVITNLVGTVVREGAGLSSPTHTTVNVGDAGNLDGIHATLNIENPDDFNNIIVDDSLDTMAPTLTLSTLGQNPYDFPSNSFGDSNTSPWGQITGLPSGASINYEYGDTGSLTLKTGVGATVDALATGLDGSAETSLIGTGTGDTANIDGNNSPLALQNYASVNIGQNGLLTHIGGGIDLINDATVSVDDSNDSIARTVTITGTTVNGFPGSSGSPWLAYSGLTRLTIRAGTPTSNGITASGGNTFYVQGTAPMPAGTAAKPGGTFIDGGQGADIFDIGSSTGTLDPIQGTLNVVGRGGNSTLNVIDTGASSDQVYDVYATQITRSPAPPGQPVGAPTQTINYFNMPYVNVYGGSGADGWVAVSTQAGTTTSLYSESSPGYQNGFWVENSGVLDGIQGPLDLHGGGGYDFTVFSDLLNAASHSYTLSTGELQRDGMANITYDGLAEFFLYAANSPSGHNTPNTINVLSLGNVSADILAGTGDTVTFGQNHSMTQIQGRPFIQGQPKQITLDDSGDTQYGRQVSFNTDAYDWGVSGLAPGRIYIDPTSPQNIQVLGSSPGPGVTLGNTFTVQNLPAVSLSIKGGSGNDAFVVQNQPAAGAKLSLNGNGGSDTLVGPNGNQTWTVTNTNAGTVDGFSFSGIANLTGGTGMDIFKFSNGARVTGAINGGGGSNWLDYSAYTTAVAVNLAAGTATGAGGGVTNIQNVRGGQGADTLAGNAMGNILIGGAGNNTITGGSGRSILIADKGLSSITGGADDDIVIGGSTSYDSSSLANDLALAAILAEWQSSDSYATRISTIKTGLPGGYALVWGTTVHDNGKANTLTGGGGMNWFFKGTLVPSRTITLGSRSTEREMPVVKVPGNSGETIATSTRRSSDDG